MKNIFIGLSLILISVMFILCSANVIPSVSFIDSEISWFAAVICIFLILFVIKKLINGRVGGIFISLSLVFMLIEKNIAISCNMDSKNIINNWILLLSVIMLEIGFSFLIKSQKNCKQNKFLTSVVYVDLQKYDNNKFLNKFGNLTIRFENAEQSADETKIYIDNKFAKTEIEVPSNVVYKCNIQNKLGNILEQKNIADESAPKLIIDGSNSFGNVCIKVV